MKEDIIGFLTTGPKFRKDFWESPLFYPTEDATRGICPYKLLNMLIDTGRVIKEKIGNYVCWYLEDDFAAEQHKIEEMLTEKEIVLLEEMAEKLQEFTETPVIINEGVMGIPSYEERMKGTETATRDPNMYEPLQDKPYSPIKPMDETVQKVVIKEPQAKKKWFKRFG